MCADSVYDRIATCLVNPHEFLTLGLLEHRPVMVRLPLELPPGECCCLKTMTMATTKNNKERNGLQVVYFCLRTANEFVTLCEACQAAQE
jgi:hypothetical protein